MQKRYRVVSSLYSGPASVTPHIFRYFVCSAVKDNSINGVSPDASAVLQGAPGDRLILMTAGGV